MSRVSCGLDHRFGYAGPLNVTPWFPPALFRRVATTSDLTDVWFNEPVAETMIKAVICILFLAFGTLSVLIRRRVCLVTWSEAPERIHAPHCAATPIYRMAHGVVLITAYQFLNRGSFSPRKSQIDELRLNAVLTALLRLPVQCSAKRACQYWVKLLLQLNMQTEPPIVIKNQFLNRGSFF